MANAVIDSLKSGTLGVYMGYLQKYVQMFKQLNPIIINLKSRYIYAYQKHFINLSLNLSISLSLCAREMSPILTAHLLILYRIVTCEQYEILLYTPFFLK